MPFFPKNSLVMKIVELVLEKEKYKKLYQKEKADNECLKSLIQTKSPFEVRA